MAAPVAIDLQALQPGSGASEGDIAATAGWAAALARAGRLAAALLAPELPAPPVRLIPPAVPPSAIGWDSAPAARRLSASRPGLVRLVPAPWLHTRAQDRSEMVTGAHWRRAGVAHAVAVSGPPPAGSFPARAEVRKRWLASAELVIELGPGGGVEGRATARVAAPFSEKEWDDLVEQLGPSLDGLNGVAPGRPRVALVGPMPPAGGGIGVYNSRFVAASERAGVVVDTVTAGGRRAPGAIRIRPDSFGVDVRPASYDAVLYTVGNGAGHLPTVEAALRHPGWVWLHEGRLPAVFTSALDEVPDEEYTARMTRLLELAYPGRAPLGSLRRAGRDHIALADGGVGLVSLLVRRARGIVVNSETARRVVMSDLPPGAWTPPVVVIAHPCAPIRPAGTRAGGRQVVTFGVVAPGKRPDLMVDAAADGGFDLTFVGPCPPILREFIGDRAAARGWSHRVMVTGEVGADEWWEWMSRADVAVQLRDSTTGESSGAVTDALSAGRPVVTNLPSAADYPDGTVEWVAGTDAGAIASTVNSLLADPDRRRRLGESALSYASAHQFDDLVAAFWPRILDYQH